MNHRSAKNQKLSLNNAAQRYVDGRLYNHEGNLVKKARPGRLTPIRAEQATNRNAPRFSGRGVKALIVGEEHNLRNRSVRRRLMKRKSMGAKRACELAAPVERVDYFVGLNGVPEKVKWTPEIRYWAKT